MSGTSDTPFVHLHCHSHYSLLDGAGKIPDLVQVASSHDMPALALTDHGNMFGAIEFYMTASEGGVKPILGYEAYVAPGSRTCTDKNQRASGYYHQTLLAMNEVGYQNLVKMSSLAYTEGFYRKPRVDLELLREYSEGVICLSGCLRSEICFALARDETQRAHEAFDAYLDIFGDRFYVEIQYNGIDLQKQVSEALIEIADKKGLPLVLTNDVHYPTPESAKVHDVLLCIQTGKTLADPDRFKFQTDEFYLKSGAEMAQVFPGRDDALAHTLDVANRCNVELTFNDYHLPPFVPPKQDDGTEMTVEEYFRHLCLEGLKERYPDDLQDDGTFTPRIMERFENEYDVITGMGFPTYFLIVADFIGHARDNGVSVGPGRGSAAGSIISYALKITNIDPLAYDLIFERFLNEGRNELPDIDIDFDAERRSEVIDYVVETYGREQVCQIVTFGKIQAKLGMRDVGRVLGLPLPLVDKVAKLIPEKPGIKIDEALAAEPDLKSLYDSDKEVRELVDIARGVEGLVRQTGVHAAGVIIADAPVSNYAPLAKDKNGIVTTQFPMEQCEKIGLLKMDFLGLKNLTIIEHTLDMIEQTTGEPRIDLDQLPLDDKGAYELLSAGDTRGIFQLESSGMREILVKLRPDTFEDVIALVALYRPGPLGSGMVDTFIDCKHGRAEITYLHPMLEGTLKSTYGVMLYQEQVMKIANEMGGFSLSESDRLRKAMGKKKHDLMAEYRVQFIEGAKSHHDIAPKISGQIFDLMAAFAGYGFNKSHSAAYALVAYQTAYLKAHFRTEFMAALVSCNAADSEKLAEYIDECRKERITVLAPDVNQAQVRFSVERATLVDEETGAKRVEKAIRYGMGAIKKCGVKALEEMIAQREAEGPFRDLFDLCQRIDTKVMNKGALESLIRAGACDELGGHRAQQMAALESFIRSGAAASGRCADQLGLFDDLAEEELPDPELPDVERWTDREQLDEEKAALGFYFSGHPLQPYAGQLKSFSTASTRSLEELEHRTTVRMGGLLRGIKTGIHQRGRSMGRKFARFVFEDLEGSCSGVAFADCYEAHAEMMVEDALVFATASVDNQGAEPGLILNSLIPLDEVDSAHTVSVVLRLDAGKGREHLDRVRGALRSSKGDVPVYIELTLPGEVVVCSTERELHVTPTAHLADLLAGLLGYEGFVFKTSAARGSALSAGAGGNGNGRRRRA